MIDRTQSEFDHFARSYESDLEGSIPSAFAEGDYFAAYKVQHMAERLAPQRPRAILDFGCGVGMSLSLLHAQFPEARLYGFDVSADSIDMARQRDSGAQFTSDLAEVPADSLDAILAANVFHHIPIDERVAALAGCGERLRAGGRMFMFEHNPLNPLTRRVFERCPFDRDAIMLRKREALGLADEAGLKVVRADYTLFFPRQLAALRSMEWMLRKIPLGAQYCVEMERRSA
jgi:SAM-dependent methyltransferase